jgi:plasmid stability protein
MPQMIVRKIPTEVHRRLKELAAKNGINAEEQARRLIAAGVNGQDAPTAGQVLEALRREFTERIEEGEIRELRGRIEQVDFS